ncbi:VgrG-related protein [Miltoncostaea marina]|uniref:VgrG-related protein n=1 Tax=Miltoncostaea marina TaxID=2843215 RepID=UPI001C3D173C|nr:VgrG-related protein [Miltoncostaea marina]
MSPAAPDGRTAQIAGVEVLVDGQPLAPTLTRLLQEVRVEDDLTLPDAFAVRISDPGLANIDAHPLQVGAEVEIRLGAPDANRLTPLMRGQITSLEPEFRADGIAIVARGYDHSHALDRTRRTATYQDTTVAEVVRKVCQRAGLRAATVEDAGGAQPFVQQTNETDWRFLWRLARRVGCEVEVADGALHFRRAGGGEPAGEPLALRYGDALRAFRPRLTGVQGVEEVVVRGWDYTAKRAIEATAGPQPPRSSIGVPRDEVARRLGGGSMAVADAPVNDQEEADALAKGVMARMVEGYLEAEGVCRGAPSLRAGSSVRVEGVGTRFSGTYRVTSTTHLFRGASGYETRFRVSGEAPRSLVGLMTPSARAGWEPDGVQVAVVTQNEDPAGLGRVRIRHPELGEDTEGWWARVAGPGAGRDRGLLMTPRVGDEVLVAYEHGDVRRPVVLGALWNGEDAPGELVQADGSFRLRSAESVGIAADRTMRITAEDELEVEVGGASVVMKKDGAISATGKEVTVKGGGSVTVEASGSLTLKAGAGITIQAGGTVRVTGAQVQLG